jgi:surface polysaccharide O-acyltransferase-like enzyme
MRAILNYVNGRLQQMPRGLSVLTNVLLLFAVLFPVITLLILVGAHNHDARFIIDGRQATYDEFWRRNGYLSYLPFFIIGIYSGILAYGFLHASRWSRPLLVLPFIVSFVLDVIYHHATLAFYRYLSPLLFITLLVWYLFFRQTVGDYYAKTHKPVV